MSALLGDHVQDLRTSREQLTVRIFPKPTDFRDYFKARYGPVSAVYGAIADDPERTAALDQALTDLAVRFTYATDNGLAMDWEYLLLTARKR